MIDKSIVNLLKIIKNMKKGEFEKLVDYLDEKSIDHICECVFNIINTDLKMSRSKIVHLKSHIKKNCNVKRLKTISNRKVSISKRKNALKQEGRGLPLLLASVIPFLANLLFK